MFEKLKRRIARNRKELKRHNDRFRVMWQGQPRPWVDGEEEDYADDVERGPALNELIQKMEERLKKNMAPITERIGKRMFGRLFQNLKEVTETYEKEDPRFIQAWESNLRSEDELAQYQAESDAFEELRREKEVLEKRMRRKIQWLKRLRAGFSKNCYTNLAEAMHAEIRRERRMRMRLLQPSSSSSPPLPSSQAQDTDQAAMEEPFSVPSSPSASDDSFEHDGGNVCEPGSSSTRDFTKASSSESSSTTDFTKAPSSGGSGGRAAAEAPSSESSGGRAVADAGPQQPRNLVRLGTNTFLIDGIKHEARIVTTTAEINGEIGWIQKLEFVPVQE
jgi:hypothetical protein